MLKESPPVSASLTVAHNNPGKNIDYSGILDTFNLQYTSKGYYYYVGQIQNTQGWIIHLSVVRQQLLDLLYLIFPMFADQKLSFEIVRNYSLAASIVEGQLGSFYHGKIIGVHTRNNQHALELAKALISITKDFDGPVILADRRLSGIVHTRYDVFEPSLGQTPKAPQTKYIYNKNGKLIIDHHNSPWSVPIPIEWPFKELSSPAVPKQKRILRHKYYPVSVIKKDAKGYVLKALYLENYWKVRFCIIKQGRQNVVYDDARRDIRDRLKWQNDLYNELAKDIPLPKILNFFEEDGDAYLVMEFIQGAAFTEILRRSYKGAVWYDLMPAIQLKVIDYLIQIATIIQCLHAKGYVHRDITPENFLLDNEGRFWLIDVELMFSTDAQNPNPPFTLGTPGFSSPEQLRIELPTEKEDIYAFGAFMLAAFTNLPPTKFETRDLETLKNNLYFFFQDKQIAALIADCLRDEPYERPVLEKIKTTLNLYKSRIESVENLPPGQKYKANAAPDSEELRETVQAALRGLSHPAVLSPDHYWISPMSDEGNIFGNEQVGMTLYEGWFKGMSGVLWVVALAQQNGFDIQNIIPIYSQCWDRIRRHCFSRRYADTSLFAGTAGIALALSEAYNSRLLSPEMADLPLSKCFSTENVALGLSDGIAGQGIALLQASKWMDPIVLQDLLTFYITELIDRQKSDGGWDMSQNSASRARMLTLYNGGPGIVWFLLEFLKKYQDYKVRQSITNALAWVIKKTGKNNHQSKTSWNTSKSIFNLALVFIKAYEVLQVDLYKNTAISMLNTLPRRPVLTGFTLASGLAGIGEVYLEAYQTFGSAEWIERADWIAQMFLHSTHYWTTGEKYWTMENESEISADLFVGNTGAIHFLMRYLSPDKLAHPLAGNSKIYRSHA